MSQVRHESRLLRIVPFGLTRETPEDVPDHANVVVRRPPKQIYVLGSPHALTHQPEYMRVQRLKARLNGPNPRVTQQPQLLAPQIRFRLIEQAVVIAFFYQSRQKGL